MQTVAWFSIRERFGALALGPIASYATNRGKAVSPEELRWLLNLPQQAPQVQSTMASGNGICTAILKTGVKHGQQCGRLMPCAHHSRAQQTTLQGPPGPAQQPGTPTLLSAPPVAQVQTVNIPGVQVSPWRDGYFIEVTHGFIVKPTSEKNYCIVGIATDAQRNTMRKLTMAEETIAGQMGLPPDTGVCSTLLELKSGNGAYETKSGASNASSASNGGSGASNGGSGGNALPVVYNFAHQQLQPQTNTLPPIGNVSMTVVAGTPTGQHFMSVLQGGKN